MGRLAAITVAACVAATLAGCGGSSKSAAGCSSFKALGRAKDQIDAADSQSIRTMKTIRTVQQLPKVVKAEKRALPTYRSVLHEATRQRDSTTDSVLRSGWSEIASAARLRVAGATAAVRAFRGGRFTASGVAAIGRISNEVNASNKRFKALVSGLNDRFGSCT